MLIPCTVRLSDPVAGLLLTIVVLTAGASTDSRLVTLAAATPPVTVMLLLPSNILPRRQIIAVSETHSEASSPVPPIRPVAETARRAIWSPTTVRLLDPVVIRLDSTAELRPSTSMDVAAETLPADVVAVMTTRRLAIMDCPA